MQCLKHPEAFEEYLWLQKVHTNYLKRSKTKKGSVVGMVSQQNIRFRPQLSQVSHVVPPVATRAQACCDVSLRMPGYAASSTYDKCRRRKCWPQRSPADPRHWWPQWDWRLRFSWVLGGKKHEHTASMKRLKWRMRFTVLMLVLTWNHLALVADASIVWNLKHFTKALQLYSKIWGNLTGLIQCSFSAWSLHLYISHQMAFRFYPTRIYVM